MQVVESNVQYRFHVHLQKYENEFNLKYNPDMTDTPYCCCANRNHCFSSTNDSKLNWSPCSTQCSLVFTLTAKLGWFEGITSEEASMITPHNFTSNSVLTVPYIDFHCSSVGQDFFPSPEFTFPFNIPSPNVSAFNKLDIYFP